MRTGHLTDDVIQSYLEAGRFESAEHALHFRGCPSCRETASAYRRLSRWLGAEEPGFVPPDDFIPSVLARLGGSPRPFPLWIFAGVAAAGAAVFAVIRFRWFGPFLAVYREASAVISCIADPLIASARAFGSGGDSFKHWLLMSCAVLLMACILDAAMRHFKEVLVDKNS
jgi:hypothetical protein